jgi:uncharacterized protein
LTIISADANSRSDLYFDAMSMKRLLSCALVVGTILVECSAGANVVRIDALVQAIRQHNLRLVDQILANHPDLNQRDRFGDTPLLEAIADHLPELSKKLVEYGADPNGAYGTGVSPLMQAAWYCDNETLNLLLEHKANPNLGDRDKVTALMNASAQCTDGKIVQKLLDSGAAVNVRSTSGETPLTVAAFYGNLKAVTLLLRSGADVTAKNNGAEDAKSIARGREVGRVKAHDQICLLLHNRH